MGLNAVKILGINVTNSPKKNILEQLEKFIKIGVWEGATGKKKRKKFVVIVTPNPEQIIYAQGNEAFARILNQADVTLPDGIGVVWASRILRRSTTDHLQSTISSRIPGVEFMQDLIAMAAKRSAPIILIGGRGDLAVETLECLRGEHPGLRGLALGAPEFSVQDGQLVSTGSDNLDEYFRQTAQKIADRRVQMVFVALGAPKQEYVIERLSREMSFRPPSRNPEKKTWIPGQARDDRQRIIFMSVGGSFDIITGRTPRAPQFMRSLGLEWLWRLFHEPWRFGRQLALVKFVWLVLKETVQRR